MQTRSVNEKTSDLSFRLFLQAQLVERLQRNPNYSLRSFAKSLSVSPSALSDMINGKRTITRTSIQKLGLELGLSLLQIEHFVRAEATGARPLSSTQFQVIDQDQFALISDWYHYAILELMKVKGFEGTPLWISKALGISRVEASAAIERLLRMNLITIEKGKWQDQSAGFSTNFDKGLVSQAMRKMQKQIVQQSAQAIEDVPFGERTHSSMTMAIDPADLAEATKMILAFQKDLCAFLERKQKPKDVYHLSVGLFPATQIRKTLKPETKANA